MAAGAAVALAGCGSGATDQGGFTSGDRKAARNVLALLGQTAVYDAALKISLTDAAVPTTCVVHIETRKPLTFRVFLSWIPSAEAIGGGSVRAYAWLDAVMSPGGLSKEHAFHQGNELTLAGLKAHYRDVFSKPVEKCLVLQNQQFGLLPS